MNVVLIWIGVPTTHTASTPMALMNAKVSILNTWISRVTHFTLNMICGLIQYKSNVLHALIITMNYA